MDYYTQKLYIPQINEQDTVIGKVERWEAHQKGILHRAFDIAIFFEDTIICQHRKHPVHDGVIDFTATSHPYFIDGKFQEMEVGLSATLYREWKIRGSDLVAPPEFIGKVLYQSRDEKYIEHEICYFYRAEIKALPQIQYEYAYGYSLLTPQKLHSSIPLTRALAPWILAALEANII